MPKSAPRALPVIALLAASLAATGTAAQQAQFGTAVEVFRFQLALENPDGRFIRGLGTDDIELFINGEARRILDLVEVDAHDIEPADIDAEPEGEPDTPRTGARGSAAAPTVEAVADDGLPGRGTTALPPVPGSQRDGSAHAAQRPQRRQRVPERRRRGRRSRRPRDLQPAPGHALSGALHLGPRADHRRGLGDEPGTRQRESRGSGEPDARDARRGRRERRRGRSPLGVRARATRTQRQRPDAGAERPRGSSGPHPGPQARDVPVARTRRRVHGRGRGRRRTCSRWSTPQLAPTSCSTP